MTDQFDDEELAELEAELWPTGEVVFETPFGAEGMAVLRRAREENPGSRMTSRRTAAGDVELVIRGVDDEELASLQIPWGVWELIERKITGRSD